MNWYAVFYRECLMMKKKIGRLGHVFSSILSPFIYLFAFGYGLGNRVEVAGGYLPFLAGGMIAITVMTNSFGQTANSISTSKMYYHIFQNLVLSPIKDVEVMFGIVLAGMARGIFFGALLFLIANLFFQAVTLNLNLLLGFFFGSFCFASLGCIVGMKVARPDDVAFVNNFLIMPMTFFGGSFFPIENLPEIFRYIAMLFPIGALNKLMRSQGDVLSSVILLFVLGSIFLWISVWLYRQYSE